MKYLAVGLIAAAVLPVFLLRTYEKDFIEKMTSHKDWLRFLYPVGLWLFDRWYRQSGKGSRQEQWAEAVYVRDSPRERMRFRSAKQLAKFWLCVILASVTVLAFSCMPDGGGRVSDLGLIRPDMGETARYELKVDGLSEEPVELTVSVSGRQPEDEEMQTVFDRAFESVSEAVLGENPSLEEVRYDLNCVQTTDYGIQVQWESRQPELISSRGKIMTEEIPEEGKIVTFQVTLSYGGSQAFYDLHMHLFPPKKDGSYYYKLLLQKLDEEDKGGKKQENMKLPDELEGKTLSYSYREKKRPWGAAVLLILAGALLPFADLQNFKKEYEERNNQLVKEYPSLLFKLNIMLSCGITLRSAWDRIVAGYLEQKGEHAAECSYVYEEMITTQNQIRAGEGEAAAYRAFGQRCREECYLRLGSYLDQNVRQGVSGIQGILETEMVHALEERRNLALRMGEAMNTRLLLPMFMMLGVVIAVLITPAILSM